MVLEAAESADHSKIQTRIAKLVAESENNNAVAKGLPN